MKGKLKPKNLLLGRKDRQVAHLGNMRLTPTTVNLVTVGTGIVLGLVSYQYRESPIGATLLGAAGSIAAIGLYFFIRELLLGPGNGEARIMA